MNDTAKKRGRYWPWIVVLLLGSSAAMDMTVCYVASQHPSFAVEEDYYEKGLAWDESIAQRRTNDELGWQIEATLTEAPGRTPGAVLAIGLTDRDGAPLPGAVVRTRLFHQAWSRSIFTSELELESKGRSATAIPVATPGLWQLETTVHHGDLLFTDRRVVELIR